MIYRGLLRAADICTQLQDTGATDAGCRLSLSVLPVAVIKSGPRPQQRVRVRKRDELSGFCDDLRNSGLIPVGFVVLLCRGYQKAPEKFTNEIISETKHPEFIVNSQGCGKIK